MLLFRADALQRTAMREIAGEKVDWRVALACGFQPLEPAQAFPIDLLQPHFSVERQQRLVLLRFDRETREFIQAKAEGVDIGFGYRDAGGHGMPAMPKQQIVTLAERSREVESRDTASRASEFRAIPAQDNRRPIVLLQHA